MNEPTLNRILDEYLAAAEAGRAPDREELLRRHPTLARELGTCLKSLDFIRQATEEARGEEPERQLGDFRILREAGRGGMGVVYEAEQISLGRRVALKVLPFAGVLDERQLQRFRHEAMAAAQLHHPHIVPIHAVGTERGVHFYAMQFVEGRTLAELIEALRTEPQGAAARTITGGSSTRSRDYCRAAARLALQAAEALDHAHERGVVHRDMKPGNVMVDARAHVWITDFGLATFQQGQGVTMTGDIVGTFRYMSPEQARAEPADHRSDVYSLGLTLHELLTLEPAFPGQDPQAVLRDVIERDPPPARRLNPAVPPELDTILLKATAKDASGRYATAGALAEDLRRFLDHRPVLAQRPGPLDHAARFARRHKSAVAAVLAVLVLALIGLAAGTMIVAREKQRTEEALLQAEDNLDTALAAVDEMLLEVGSDLLADVPMMEPIRVSLLQKALAFHAQFLEVDVGNPELRRRAGRAYRRVGDIRRRLGKPREADDAYERALVLLPTHEAVERVEALRGRAQLRLDERDYEAARARLEEALEAEPAGVLAADVQGEISHVLDVAGSREEALAARRRAVEIADSTPDGLALARHLGGLADMLRTEEPPVESEALYARAVAILKDLAVRQPDSVALQTQLARALREQGKLLERRKFLIDAEANFVQARDTYAALVERFPLIPSLRASLAEAWNDIVFVCRWRRDLEGALLASEHVLSQYEFLLDRFPGHEEYQSRHAMHIYGRGNLLSRSGRWNEALEHHQASVDALERLLAHGAQPGSREPRKHFESVNVVVLDAGTHLDCREFIEHPLHHLHLMLSHFGRHAEEERVLRRKSEIMESLGRGGDGTYVWFLLGCEDPAFRNPAEALARIQAIERAKDPRNNGAVPRLLAFAQYRNGLFEEAANTLAGTGAGSDDVRLQFVEAMILYRAGHANDARAVFDKAAAGMLEIENHDTFDALDRLYNAERRRYMAEAAAVLGLDPLR